MTLLKNAYLLLAVLFFLSVQTSMASTTPADDEKVVIEKKVQKIEFFFNKKKELVARLSVDMTVVSKTNLSYKFSQSIGFDNTSKVGSITKKAGRRTQRIDPIISDYESDGIFHSDMKLCYFEHRFTGEDESIDIHYEKVFLDLKFLGQLYFNDAYPVKDSKVIVEVPDFMTLDIREWNFDKEKPDFKKSKDKSTTIHTYSMSDLKSAFRYKGEPRRNKVNAHLILIPNAYKKDGKTISLMKDAGDLYSWYASLVKQIGNENQELKSLVKELTAGKTDDLEKIKSIFYWVQDNIRYIAFEYGIMGFKPESCQKVYGNKYGDCKGMANLTKEMLTLAGYDARLTWIGTNDLPYSYDIPSLIVDNHMICTVIHNGEKIYLDATEKYADLYKYAYRIQGKQVLIENGDDFIIETVPVMKLGDSKEVTKHLFSINENQLTGKGSVTFSGDRKSWMLYVLSTIPETDWDKYIKRYIVNGDKNLQLELLDDVSLDSRDKDYRLEYNITVDNHIIDLGNELYISPETDFQFQNFEMPDDRDAAYEFSGTYHIDIQTELKMPEGWSLQYLPEAININTDKYSFQLAYTSENGHINYSKKLEIKKTLLLPEEFTEWNKHIKQLNTFYSDQIIISKK